MRHILTAGLLIAGISAAQAQTVTPGIGGVAVTGQTGAGIYFPWNGSAVVGAPGVGSYNLNGGAYTSPYSLNQFNNPNAYNFNTGTFNYNSGVYSNGVNSELTTTSYYNSPYSNGNVILNSGYNSYPSSYGYTYPTTGYTSYPVTRGYTTSPWTGTSVGSTWGTSVTTPVIYTNSRGRLRWR